MFVSVYVGVKVLHTSGRYYLMICVFQGRRIPDMYDMHDLYDTYVAHGAAWEPPHNMHDLVQVSWVGSVLY